MKTLTKFLAESSEVILYNKRSSHSEYLLDIPSDIKNAKFRSFNFGRLGKKIYSNLDEAIDACVKSDGLTFEYIEKITYKDSIVDVQYCFGSDKFGFSLKKI